MDLVFNAYIAAFLIGVLHAVEVDHMVAVTMFTAMKPQWRASMGYGARWGFGHALMVIFVGAGLAWFDIKIPSNILGVGEILVGLLLICLGMWAWRRSRTFHAHPPFEHSADQSKSTKSALKSDQLHDAASTHNIAHGHLHSHDSASMAHSHSAEMQTSNHQHTHTGNAHKHHQHLPTMMGAVHGLAGSAPILALIPVTLLSSFQEAMIYLLVFSVGATLSMTIYAGLAAAAVSTLGLSKTHVKRLTMLVAQLTILVGVWWVVSAIFWRG